MLPARRTAEAMGDLCEPPPSDATVLAAVAEAGERLEPSVAVIAQAVVATPVVHADETIRYSLDTCGGASVLVAPGGGSNVGRRPILCSTGYEIRYK